jgi:hypothetical protein
MAKDPAFLMYYKQWLVSTAGWDADIRGWYINLLCHQADKPEGLPSDLESVAELAGVKISQFKRFEDGWKRTLEAKFKKNKNGNLINQKQEMVLNDRKDYSENQSRRGIIGFFIKNARSTFRITDDQATQLSILLSKEDLVNKTKEERLECYKRTLIALIGNVNVDVIINGLKGGAGGNKSLPKFKEEPDWWMGERGNFLGDVVWKKDFAEKKNVGYEDLTKRMNDFVTNIHLISDFKDCAALKKHFLFSYNKWVENGGHSAKEMRHAKSNGFIEVPKNIDYENLEGKW